MAGVLGMALWQQGVAVALEQWSHVKVHTKWCPVLQDSGTVVLLLSPAAAKLVGE